MTGHEHIKQRTTQNWDPAWFRFDDSCAVLRKTRLNSVKTLQTVLESSIKCLQPVFEVG